jgi:outer membrane protein, heavy metal efflux system
LSGAETASNQAHDRFLTLQAQTVAQRLELNHLLGLPADTRVRLQPNIELPAHLDLPTSPGLLEGLEQRRLDLVALRAGYESQEAAVRAAILAQFPKINLGGNRMRDTSNVGSYGLAVTMDLPIFDRNQGTIALERATRQKLFDEYVNRVFEARADIARLLEEGQSLNEQIENAKVTEPGLERLVNAYRAAMDAGQADVLSYYTAWNNLAEQRSRILSLEQQLMQTRVSLELASGLYRLETLDKDKRDK